MEISILLLSPIRPQKNKLLHYTHLLFTLHELEYFFEVALIQFIAIRVVSRKNSI